MKKIILISFLSIVTAYCRAQIDLEHTFENSYITNGYYVYPGIIPFLTSTHGGMYYQYDEKSKIITLYNTDYSLYKSIHIDNNIIISGGEYTLTYILYISDKLFNDNDLIEFVAVYRSDSIYKIDSISGSKMQYKIKDENDNTLKDFPEKYYGGFYIFYIGNNSYKLMIEYWDVGFHLNHDVYSVPGTLPAGYPNGTKYEEYNKVQNYPFPNPANNFIELPYKLSMGESTIMNIYDGNGKLIEQKRIDSTFDRILLNTTSYKSGVYIYKYNGIINKFIVTNTLTN
jgi:hypothetical protein